MSVNSFDFAAVTAFAGIGLFVSLYLAFTHPQTVVLVTGWAQAI